MEKLAFSVTEVAKSLGISRSYAYDLVKRNEIPVMKLGRRVVVPKVWLEQWITEKSSFERESQ